MTKDENFGYCTADSTGYLPPLQLIGKEFRHSGNGHVYTINGFVWLGDSDFWGVQHTREGSQVMCVRSHLDFFGQRTGLRYTAV